VTCKSQLCLVARSKQGRQVVEMDSWNLHDMAGPVAGAAGDRLSSAVTGCPCYAGVVHLLRYSLHSCMQST
jgi:hypothetical protein